MFTLKTLTQRGAVGEVHRGLYSVQYDHIQVITPHKL